MWLKPPYWLWCVLNVYIIGLTASASCHASRKPQSRKLRGAVVFEGHSRPAVSLSTSKQPNRWTASWTSSPSCHREEGTQYSGGDDATNSSLFHQCQFILRRSRPSFPPTVSTSLQTWYLWTGHSANRQSNTQWSITSPLQSVWPATIWSKVFDPFCRLNRFKN